MAATPEEVKSFIRRLTTTTGKYAGLPFKLYPFQDAWIDLIFGQDDDGNRIRREVTLGIGRKNGKTELTAAICLALLVIDGERGGLVIGAAAKREQASLMLTAAKRMVYNSSIDGIPLSDFLKVYRTGIYFAETDSWYKVIAADAQKEHGLNPHAFVIDEGHAALETSRELYDTLLTAQGARDNPVGIVITTAGPTPQGPMYDLYTYGKKVNSGEIEDPSFGMIWHEAPEDCAVDDMDAARIANPALGDFLNEKFLRDQAKSVLSGRMPEFMYRRLHLNQWTTASERWMPVSKWNACAGTPEFPTDEPIFVAIDAAIRRDTMAVAYVRVERDVPFQREDDPDIIDTVNVAHAKVKVFRPVEDGGYIDPNDVLTFILGLSMQYEVQQIDYDPAYMQMLASTLADRGFNIEPFPQSADRMTRATETLQRIVLDGRLRHGGDPTLSRHIASVATKPTERGVRITKKPNGMPNDAAVALAMALDTALGGEDPDVQDFAVFVQ